MVYQERLSDIPPFYDECPSICYKLGKREESEQDSFCNSCEIKIAKDFFEEETITILNERLGDKWKKYGFKNLYHQVRATFEIKEDDNLSVTAKTMVDILLSEENRQRRIDDWNRKQKNKDK